MKCTKTPKHVMPADADERIAEALTGATDRSDYSAKLDALQQAFGVPRYTITRRAAALGVRSCRVMWSEDERRYLRRNAGVLPVKTMARFLGRGSDSVLYQLAQMGLSARGWRGYTAKALAKLLGVSDDAVRRWKTLLLLVPDGEGFYSQARVEVFLREHLDLVQWRWADTIWLAETLTAMLHAAAKESTDAGYDKVASPQSPWWTKDEVAA